MKPKMITTIFIALAALAVISVNAFAREIQASDDRSQIDPSQGSLILAKNASLIIDDRLMRSSGLDDLTGGGRVVIRLSDDGIFMSRGADDIPGDDRGLFSHGIDDLPGDDKGGSTQLITTTSRISGEPEPGDDKGGLTQGSTSSSSDPSQPQPVDDHGGHGNGKDDPSGHK